MKTNGQMTVLPVSSHFLRIFVLGPMFHSIFITHCSLYCAHSGNTGQAKGPPGACRCPGQGVCGPTGKAGSGGGEPGGAAGKAKADCRGEGAASGSTLPSAGSPCPDSKVTRQQIGCVVDVSGQMGGAKGWLQQANGWCKWMVSCVSVCCVNLPSDWMQTLR